MGRRIKQWQQVETMLHEDILKPIGVATTPTRKSTTLNLQYLKSSGDVLSSLLRLYIHLEMA